MPRTLPKKQLRLCLAYENEIIAGVNIYYYQLIPTGLIDSVPNLRSARKAALNLGFERDDVDVVEGPFYSGNVEGDHGHTLFQFLTLDEVMELPGIQKAYDGLNEMDRTLFDHALKDPRGNEMLESENFKSWRGPSLHC